MSPSDGGGVTCLAMGRGDSGEDGVRISCFGRARKAKPLSLPFKADASQAAAPEALAVGRQDSASDLGATGQAKARIWSSHGASGCALEELEQEQASARPAQEAETAAAPSPHKEGKGMHDSGSSLKHGKDKAAAAAAAAEVGQAEEAGNDEGLLQPEWEINPHDIYFCSSGKGKLVRLGKGAFGVVYKGAFKGETVAVKVCKQQHVTVKAMKQFQKEVAILFGCDHPNVVQFKGACCWKGGKRTVLVTEFAEKGDLCSALGRAPAKFGWERLGRRIALDVARGLAFLHAGNVVHFDLKSANILLDNAYRAKLADVGLAKPLTQTHGGDSLSTVMATGDLGTFAWAAPEVLLGFPCDSKADIFSFGVVMWELITAELPQGRCLRPIRVPEEASEEVAELIENCLRHDPAARPTAEQLVAFLEALQ